MPYILQTEAALDMKNNPGLIKTPGQLNYVYTLEYIRMWIAKPSYATFHNISRTIDRPESDDGVLQLTRAIRGLNGWAKETDLLVARREAVNEFRRRVMAPYEDAKANTEGNVDPYITSGIDEVNLVAPTEE